MHSLRTVRPGLPERAGERDVVDWLGTRTPPGIVGRWNADWRLELCFLRSLRHCLSLQRPDGEVHAGRGWIHDRSASTIAREDDRSGKGGRAGGGLWGDHAGVTVRGEDARVAHQEDQDRVYLLRRRLQLRRMDERPGGSQDRTDAWGCERDFNVC